MKTFLHYTKEKELHEQGIMSRIGSFAGGAVTAAKKFGGVLNTVGNTVSGALETGKKIGQVLGGKDGKIGTSIQGVADLGKGREGCLHDEDYFSAHLNLQIEGIRDKVRKKRVSSADAATLIKNLTKQTEQDKKEYLKKCGSFSA